MGASLGPKLVIACGTPSSNSLKFSRLSPVMISPRCVVATTSIVTTGTSTAMESPPSCGLGCGGFCAGGVCCGWPPGAGPVGACAQANEIPAAKNPTKIRPRSACASVRFILTPQGGECTARVDAPEADRGTLGTHRICTDWALPSGMLV